MCGICGTIYWEKSRTVRQDEIHQMTQLIHHRGPDDSGIYLDQNAGLGFRRLSIIDLTKGHQPLSNEDGTLWIVFNGEIYNHKVLRRDLIQRGHRFKTEADTEAIIHLYEEYGADCVQHLRGMFAFAIWDEKKRKLFCARDRFGIKPFYYHLGKHGFIFGSEMKSILSQMEKPPTMALTELDHYLTYGYTSRTHTIYSEIEKLKPGHTMTISEDGQVRIEKYWEIEYTPDYGRSEEEWCTLLQDKLSESVASHMMSDVPLGAFLSGGIDSSAVVALMAKHSDRPVKTFSIGFKDDNFNELRYARDVAKQYGTEHHEKLIEPESVDLLAKLIASYDEPFADSSAIPTYLVSQFAREFVTVALSGDGGDELFAGYKQYLKFNRIKNYNPLPPSLNPAVWGSLHKLIPNGIKGKGLAYYLAKPPQNLPAYQSIWQTHERKQLYSKGLSEQLGTFQAEKERVAYLRTSKSSDYIFNMQRLDLESYMVDDILMKVDRASMQNSLEVRVPILDHEFAELTFSIPSELKLKGLQKKYIFKKAMRPLLPESVLAHKKQGFNLPMKMWFKDDLNDFVQDHLLNSNSPIYDYFEKRYVSKIIHEHNNAMRDFHRKIWSLIFLDQWLSLMREASKGPSLVESISSTHIVNH